MLTGTHGKIGSSDPGLCSDCYHERRASRRTNSTNLSKPSISRDVCSILLIIRVFKESRVLTQWSEHLYEEASILVYAMPGASRVISCEGYTCVSTMKDQLIYETLTFTLTKNPGVSGLMGCTCGEGLKCSFFNGLGCSRYCRVLCDSIVCFDSLSTTVTVEALLASSSAPRPDVKSAVSLRRSCDCREFSLFINIHSLSFVTLNSVVNGTHTARTDRPYTVPQSN